MDDNAAFQPDHPYARQCIHNGAAVFDWDKSNLRKIRGTDHGRGS